MSDMKMFFQLPDNTPQYIRELIISVYQNEGSAGLGKLIVDRVQGRLGTTEISAITGYSPTWVRRVAKQAADKGETWIIRTSKGWEAYYFDWITALNKKRKRRKQNSRN